MVAESASGTEQSTTKPSGYARAFQAAPIFLAVVLLAAAFLKGLELATEELWENSVMSSRWFWVALVLFELGLGTWILGGLHPRGTRWLLLGTFFVFFETAVYFTAVGYASCQCLGRASVPPWIAAVFDATAIAAVVLWQPPRYGPTVASNPRRLVLVGLLYALAAFPALASMLSYTPTGRMPLLRNDPDLKANVTVQLKRATPQELLEHLSAATGLTITIDDRLADNWPGALGEIRTTGTPAWALMELLVHKQTEPTRWRKVEGGYHLARSAPMGMRTPWLISGAALLVAGAYLFFTRGRTRVPEREWS